MGDLSYTYHDEMSGVMGRPNAPDLSAAVREFPSAEVRQHSNTTVLGQRTRERLYGLTGPGA
jgi:hypothetical protein